MARVLHHFLLLDVQLHLYCWTEASCTACTMLTPVLILHLQATKLMTNINKHLKIAHKSVLLRKLMSCFCIESYKFHKHMKSIGLQMILRCTNLRQPYPEKCMHYICSLQGSIVRYILELRKLFSYIFWARSG